MSIADIPQLQNLTAASKLDLIEELWKSLSPESGAAGEELDRLLSERIAYYEAHPDSMLTLEEFQRRWAEMKR